MSLRTAASANLINWILGLALVFFAFLVLIDLSQIACIRRDHGTRGKLTLQPILSVIP